MTTLTLTLTCCCDSRLEATVPTYMERKELMHRWLAAHAPCRLAWAKMLEPHLSLPPELAHLAGTSGTVELGPEVPEGWAKPADATARRILGKAMAAAGAGERVRVQLDPLYEDVLLVEEVRHQPGRYAGTVH